jgi:hypothetical protein
MQTLALAEEFFNYVEENKKIVTIRRGKRDILPGKLLFTSTNSDRTIEVEVERVTYTYFYNLTEDDALNEGASSLDELIKGLKLFYPEIDDFDIITIIEFYYIDRDVEIEFLPEDEDI